MIVTAVLVVMFQQDAATPDPVIVSLADFARGELSPEPLERTHPTAITQEPSKLNAAPIGSADWMVVSLQQSLRDIVQRLREIPDQDLDELFGNYSSSDLRDTKIGRSLSELNTRHSDLHWEQCLQLAREADSKLGALPNESGKPNVTQEIWERASEVLASTDDDLTGEWCTTLESLSSSRITTVLVFFEPGPGDRERRFYEALWVVLLRTVATQDERVGEHLIYPLSFAMVKQEITPYNLWREATDSGMTELTKDVYIWLVLFPVEQVEPLLLSGLRDPRRLVHFGAMEAVRYYGEKGLIDTAFYAQELVAIAIATPKDSLYYLEAIAAIGEVDPALLDLVAHGVDATLRNYAAGFYVGEVDPETARRAIISWISDVELAEAGFVALGTLPGEAADELLHDLADESSDDLTLARVLQAMSGRGPEFATELAAAVRSRNETVRRMATEGLLTLAANGRGTGASAHLVSSGLQEVALHDSNNELRERALFGLALNGSPADQEFLKDRFLSEPDSMVRAVAGGMVLLSAGDDPDERAWAQDVVAGESFLVRRGLNELIATLSDEGERNGLLRSLDAEATPIRLASGIIDEKAMAKNPLSTQLAMIESVKSALLGWEEDATAQLLVK